LFYFDKINAKAGTRTNMDKNSEGVKLGLKIDAKKDFTE
jgi:hypothetical protein